MLDVLLSGKESFKVEVPYKLIESGKQNSVKPLLVYLHSFGSNIKKFEEDCLKLLDLEAYHLFIQGPYPLYDTSMEKNVSEWGRSWLLSDGNRGQYIKSLEISSEFIQQMVDKLQKLIRAGRMGVIGYGMGGTLATYFAFTRWKHVTDVAVYNGQFLPELINDQYEHIDHMNIVAIEGKDQGLPDGYSTEKSIETLHNHGVSATFKPLNGQDGLTLEVADLFREWLYSQGYVQG